MIGDPLLRREDARLLAGRARFVDDLHLDRMVQGVFIRSPMAHAEILGIDASAALAAGALLVLTAQDLPYRGRDWIVRYWHPAIRGGLVGFMAADRVRYVGEPVAFLVAADRYLAEDLAELVQVEYRALPPVPDTRAAQAPDAALLHESWPRNVAAAFSQRLGYAEAALAAAPRRLRRRFRFGRQSPLPLETRGVVAEYDADGPALTVTMSTQAHYNVRQNLATLLDLPEHCVRVVAEDVGGGFGGKSRTYPEEIAVAEASRRLRRPVKWIEDRLESLAAMTHSRDADTWLEAGYDETGRLLALTGDLTIDIGGYVHTSGIVTAEIAGAYLMGPYAVPNLALEVRCVGTNKTPLATYRGAGQPEATFPLEALLDLVARDIGMDPVALRLRNLVTPAMLPHLTGTALGATPVRFESGDFPALLRQAVAESRYDTAVEVLPSGERAAWGLACGLETSGFVNYESAELLVDLQGRITLRSGMSTQGQGQPTTYAQVAAETLGVPFESITVRMGDTALQPFGRGAFASRGAVMGANAVHGAALALRAKVLAHAGTLLQRDPAALSLEAGRIRDAGRETPLGLADIARAVAPGGALYGGDPVLSAEHVFGTDQLLTFGVLVHCARVALDPRTGFWRVLDYYIAHDCGRPLNRMVVEGQIIGGAVDGIGGAMLSELRYDDRGQLLTGTLADYLVASATEAPRIRLGHAETRPGTNPLGVRGVGEGGTVPAGAALASALIRAVRPTGLGHEAPLLRLPLAPERVFEALRLAGG